MELTPAQLEELSFVDLVALAFAVVEGAIVVSEEQRSLLLETLFRREHEVRDLKRLLEMPQAS